MVIGMAGLSSGPAARMDLIDRIAADLRAIAGLVQSDQIADSRPEQ